MRIVVDILVVVAIHVIAKCARLHINRREVHARQIGQQVLVDATTALDVCLEHIETLSDRGQIE